jgi:hypothetical protein
MLNEFVNHKVIAYFAVTYSNQYPIMNQSIGVG